MLEKEDPAPAKDEVIVEIQQTKKAKTFLLKVLPEENVEVTNFANKPKVKFYFSWIFWILEFVGENPTCNTKQQSCCGKWARIYSKARRPIFN